ncbi:MAG: helix-turn-helix domain-containing protein [Rubrivivax sp.]
MRLQGHQFYGRFEQRWDVAAFCVARLQASAPEHAVAPHQHVDAHFVLVLAGRYRSAASGHTLGPGALVWNPAGTEHRDHFTEAGGAFLALSLGAGPAAELGLDQDAPRLLGGAALQTASALATTPASASASELLDLEAQCHELCVAAGAPTPRAAADRRTPVWLRRCMERLLDDPVRTPSLAALALEAGVHPVSLARAFRRHYGLPPGRLQRRVQLNRAAALLRQGGGIADVAAACGFADQSHFTRSFRGEYGSTPAAWQAGFKPF